MPNISSQSPPRKLN